MSDTDNPKSPFELISTEIKYQNPWMSVREDIVRNENGKEGLFGVATLKDGANVLIMDDDSNVYLANEYKYAVDAVLPGVFGGALDDGEEPISAARRELEEESGLIARDIIPLGALDPLTTIIKQREYCFLARGVKSGKRHLEDLEVINVIKVPFSTAVDWAMSGKISHGASVATILRAKIYLDELGSRGKEEMGSGVEAMA